MARLDRPRTGVTPGGGDARFPGFDVLAQRQTWDDETAGVVLARLAPPGKARFFTEEERPTARALVDRLTGQEDDGHRVAVLELVDQRLLEQVGDGYRYEDMPEDWDAWHLSIRGLDEDSRERFGEPFHALPRDAQIELIEAVQATDGAWHGMPAGRLFTLWMRYVCAAFYSHPWSWNEIGFGGPAYPRGYSNLGVGRRETWERPERDARDPIPWVERVEAAKKAHAARTRP